MSTLQLTATTRDKEKSAKRLRATGMLPGIVYGHNVPSKMVSLPLNDFYKVYHKAGESTIIDLKVDNKPSEKVLIYDLDHDVLTNEIIHVDFYRIKMNEKIQVEVPLHFIGEAPAVKEMGGVLVKQLDHLTVRCLPQDLVKSLDVKLDDLTDFQKVIRVGDLRVPQMITMLRDKNEVIVTVSAPRVEEKAPVTPEAEEAVVAEAQEGVSQSEAETSKDAANQAETEDKATS